MQDDRRPIFEHDVLLFYSVSQAKEVLRSIFPPSGLTINYCKLYVQMFIFKWIDITQESGLGVVNTVKLRPRLCCHSQLRP